MVGVSVRKKSLEENEEPEVGEMIVTKDYISAGNLIGELAMLTSARRNSSCTCESEVQVPNIVSYLSFPCSSLSIKLPFCTECRGVAVRCTGKTPLACFS